MSRTCESSACAAASCCAAVISTSSSSLAGLIACLSKMICPLKLALFLRSSSSRSNLRECDLTDRSVIASNLAASAIRAVSIAARLLASSSDRLLAIAKSNEFCRGTCPLASSPWPLPPGPCPFSSCSSSLPPPIATPSPTPLPPAEESAASSANLRMTASQASLALASIGSLVAALFRKPLVIESSERVGRFSGSKCIGGTPKANSGPVSSNGSSEVTLNVKVPRMPVRFVHGTSKCAGDSSPYELMEVGSASFFLVTTLVVPFSICWNGPSRIIEARFSNDDGSTSTTPARSTTTPAAGSGRVSPLSEPKGVSTCDTAETLRDRRISPSPPMVSSTPLPHPLGVSSSRIGASHSCKKRADSS
mmetsp:Transcript_41493/g.102401  ORF Transcript_41493/g.102401 Transcript_41493/m.102401 type:complete len:364 (+) Transcript_41493:582-1673(+)